MSAPIFEPSHTVTIGGSGAGLALLVASLAWVGLREEGAPLLGFGGGKYHFHAGMRKVWGATRHHRVFPLWYALAAGLLASGSAGGLLGWLTSYTTGSGNWLGSYASDAATGLSGTAKIHSAGHLSPQGAWIAIILIGLMVLIAWFGATWEVRAFVAIGAIAGTTWGLATIGGFLSDHTLTPLANWIGSILIG
jgi:hypothetical protein